MTRPAAERTALYRLYDAAGHLLYVGVARNPDVRWATHSQSKPWWSEVDTRKVEWIDSRAEAERAELAVIRAEHPLYNVVGTPAATISGRSGKTPTRPIRVHLKLWEAFGSATKVQGQDRSAALRAFMAWYCDEPGAELPERPARTAWTEAEKPVEAQDG
ncbi:GIY-YIG nuclease family protein [Streptomyces massasporeus]|uniref:GIY-YIG nuclease family protein n=1 Tax=Streptomyces massasporeus TaxID=67324 RepID=UPI0037035180